jgi:hypothetical protein
MINSQEQMIAKMNAGLAEMKDSRKEMVASQKAMEANPEKMEANPDEMTSVTVHEEVPKEEAAEKSFVRIEKAAQRLASSSRAMRRAKGMDLAKL